MLGPAVTTAPVWANMMDAALLRATTSQNRFAMGKHRSSSRKAARLNQRSPKASSAKQPRPEGSRATDHSPKASSPKALERQRREMARQKLQEALLKVVPRIDRSASSGPSVSLPMPPNPAGSRRRRVDAPGCAPRSVSAGRAHPKQPFPTTGPLATRRDLALEQLEDDLSHWSVTVYPYVVASTRDFEQRGCSPNWQGGLITLCACKRRDRTGPRFAPGKRLWVAGITPSSRYRRRHLLYLMLVRDRFQSQVELYKSLAPDVRAAKSASQHPLGDIYEPKTLGIVGGARFDVRNYTPPCAGHTHQANDEWHLDIDYPGRPWMLVGDPRFSYIWSEPSIGFDEPGDRLPRQPAGFKTLTEFFRRLVAEDR